jgi:two-component system, chemotaxis family, sensor kinase CheA
MDEILKDFLTETGEQLESIGAQLVRFEQDPSDARIIANIFRLVHAIKGTCGFLNLPRLEKVAHAAETLIGRLRDGDPPSGEVVTLVLTAVDRIKQILSALVQGAGEPEGDDTKLIAEIESIAEHGRNSALVESTGGASWDAGYGPGPTPPERRLDTVRVSVQTLERMMSLVSELVLTRNQLADVARAIDGETLQTPLQRLSNVTADLQNGILAARMQPIERLFANFHRLVRDLTTDLGKKAELVLRGGGTELDRQLIEVVRDPLTHMIRNAIDHGIEPPEERRALGKSEIGTVRITARHQAGHVTIEVADDGRGLDVASIRDRAFALGLGSREELSRLPESDLCRFVFAPGFTTAQRVTNISGRGVGLDIVRANIEDIGGSISLASRAGHGAKILLRIPLTLAIVPALIIDAGQDRFALPQHSVEEIVEIDRSGDDRLAELQGAQILRLGDDIVPTVELRRLTLGASNPAAERADVRLALRIRAGARSFAILVDDIADVQEIVLKPLPSQLDDLTLFSGSTILGDGSVVLVLDPQGLGAALGLPKSDGARINPQLETWAPPPSTKVVLFRDGAGAIKALPLSLVSRIQNIIADEIQMADGAAMLRINDRLVPVLRVSHVRFDVHPQRSLAVLLLQEGSELVGLAVDEIVDIVDEEMRLEIAGRSEGVLGVAVIRGETAEVLDAFHYIDMGRQTRRPQSKSQRRAKILIADSSDFYREMLGGMLREAGHSVDVAASAVETLAILAREQGYDALLIDLDIACKGDGEFARQINLASSRIKPLLIAMDEHGGQAAQIKARAAGLAGAVGKFDRAALRAALSRACANATIDGVAA